MTATASTRPARLRSAAGLGVGLMLLGMFLFSANDVLGKWLVATYSVGQVLLLRSVAALVLLSPFLWRLGWRPLLRPERPGLQATRVAFSTAEVFLFYLAVVYLPLADVMTYYLAAPIYVAAMSPLLLGEQVGWRRWTAIAVGFVGVLVALQPSAATLTLPAFISIAGSLAFAFMIVTGRTLRGTPDTTLIFWQTAGALVAGMVLAPWNWVEPDAASAMLLGLLGIVSMVAHVCVNRSLKLADAAAVAPFQYTLLLWAILFGYLVFGDVPRASMLAGAVVIVGAGLFIFFREQRKAAPPGPELPIV